MKAYLFDNHCHTHYSPDGASASIRELAEAGKQRGLAGLAVTDHCEVQLKDFRDYIAGIHKCAAELEQWRREAEDPGYVTLGVELGGILENKKDAAQLIADLPFDYILGSLHNLKGWPDFYHVRYDEMSQEELDSMMGRYFSEMTEFSGWGKIDALAHIALPARYMKIHSRMDMDLTRYRDGYDLILRALIQDGVALEVNTSGLRNALNSTIPPDWVIRRYRELGGELVVIGSDAHHAKDLGEGLEAAAALLREAGFRYTACYRRRKPVMLPLD